MDFIYDRTEQDILNCKQIADEIRNSGIITQEYLLGLKGSINYIDLNRIETNTVTLSNLMNENGYFNVVSTKTNWGIGQLLTLEEVNRIRNNIDGMIDSFYKLTDFVDIVYNNTLDFNQVNALEWDLYWIKYSFEKIVVGYLYSGEIQSGEGV